MTRKVITIEDHETIERVELGMEMFHFRHLPVVKEGKLVGIITHRDMVQISSSPLSSDASRRNQLIHQLPAGRIMKTDVRTVKPELPLARAAEIIWENKIGCVVVVNDDREILGIVTEADFVRLAIQLLADNADAAQ